MKAAEKRKMAVQLVMTEEREHGRTVETLTPSAQRMTGCTFLSHHSASRESDRILVQAWGNRLVTTAGLFTDDIQLSLTQFQAAASGAPFRLEIVANMDTKSARDYHRLTLHGDQIVGRAIIGSWRVQLTDPRFAKPPVRGVTDLAAPTPPSDPVVWEYGPPDYDPLMNAPIRTGATLHDWEQTIDSDQLSDADVPQVTDNWEVISRFALTLNGYQRFGDDDIGPVANMTHQFFTERHCLPPDYTLDLLRGCLFFEQRRYHHYGYAPDTAGADYIRALIAAMRKHLTLGSS